PREPEHTGDRIRLEHGANGVGRHSEPVSRRPALALEVDGGQWAVRTDPLEHALPDIGVLGEGPRRVTAQVPAEPRELARRYERKPLVVRLEDLTAFVEVFAPAGVVVGDASHELEVEV